MSSDQTLPDIAAASLLRRTTTIEVFETSARPKSDSSSEGQRLVVIMELADFLSGDAVDAAREAADAHFSDTNGMPMPFLLRNEDQVLGDAWIARVPDAWLHQDIDGQ